MKIVAGRKLSPHLRAVVRKEKILGKLEKKKILQYILHKIEEGLRKNLTLDEIGEETKLKKQDILVLIDHYKKQSPIFFLFMEKLRADEVYEVAKIKAKLYSEEAVERARWLMERAKNDDVKLRSAAAIGRWAGLEESPPSQQIVLNLDKDRILKILQGMYRLKQIEQKKEE